MKKILLLALAILTMSAYAQTKHTSPDHLRRHERDVFENSNARINPKKKIPQPLFVPNTTFYKPINEVDSHYDPSSQTWFYNSDFIHTYYKSNCLDSVITYTDHGVSFYRMTYKDYDRYGAQYQFGETWKGGQWVKDYLQLDYTLQPTGCGFYDYIYDLTWNGATWDTADGRKTVSVILDSYNNPLYLMRQNYKNNKWTNNSEWILSYDGAHSLLNETYTRWDTIQMRFIPQWRDTNYTYYYYNSFCDYFIRSNIRQTWDGAAWQNTTKFYFSNHSTRDTTLQMNWNGSSFADTAYITIYEYDNEDHYRGEQDYAYNSPTWNLDYYDWDILTYGTNNEIIRIENFNDFYSTPDSIFPNYIYTYSNFITCTTTGINEAAASYKIIIYPNPLTSSSTLQLTTQLKDAEVTIYDMLGKEMLRKKLTGDRMEIEKGSLESGVYFVRVRSEERQWMEKVVVE